MHPVLLFSPIFILLPRSSANPFCLTALCGYKCPRAIQNAVINAEGQAFWIGLKGPGTYCPSPPVKCAEFPGTETLLVSNVPGYLSMWDVVPGGQRVFVNPDGTIAYTQAHSAKIPAGSYVAGFTNITTTPSCHPPSATIISWSTPGDSSKGILACPLAAGHVIQPTKYKLYARTEEFNRTGCVELVGLMEHVKPTTAFNAWQYT